ncbi:MAG: histidine kinase, partial [Pseudomonadota bacterium]
MSLRKQLLLISLATLILPWAGCEYAREMEEALRQGQQDALLGSAAAVANALAVRPELLYRDTELAEAPPSA